jgi:hypothetical protein
MSFVCPAGFAREGAHVWPTRALIGRDMLLRNRVALIYGAGGAVGHAVPGI